MPRLTFVVVRAVVVFVALVVVLSGAWTAANDALGPPRHERYAHLVDARGLASGDRVWLGGVDVGEVTRVELEQVEQPCVWDTEDHTTDDCDAHAFCSPRAMCAELEAYASQRLAVCISTDDCDAGSVCVERELRRLWAGPSGVCVTYVEAYDRVAVTFEVEASAIPFIARDSVADVRREGKTSVLDVRLGLGTVQPPGLVVRPVPPPPRAEADVGERTIRACPRSLESLIGHE